MQADFRCCLNGQHCVGDASQALVNHSASTRLFLCVATREKLHSENTLFSHFYTPPLMLRKATSIPIQPILLKLEAIYNFPSVEKWSEATRIYAVPRNALITFPGGCRKMCPHRANCYAKNQNEFYFITLASVIFAPS